VSDAWGSTWRKGRRLRERHRCNIVQLPLDDITVRHGKYKDTRTRFTSRGIRMLVYGVGSIVSYPGTNYRSAVRARHFAPTTKLPVASPGFPSPGTTSFSQTCRAFVRVCLPCPRLIPPSAEPRPSPSPPPACGRLQFRRRAGRLLSDATKSRELALGGGGGLAGPWIRLRVRARNQPGAG
jgi:hypothetical protein